MANFSFDCPRCNRTGNNSELNCYNCGNSIELLSNPSDYESTSEFPRCKKCYLPQIVNCPSCDTEITYELFERETSNLEKVGQGCAVTFLIIVGYFIIQFLN